jgi:hypothetical protein
MKKPFLCIAWLVVLLTISIGQSKAQDEGTDSKFNIGADIYSNYIWRGSKYGTGPAIQPGLTFTTGGLTLGVWGSFDARGYTETDPYISYSFPFGLSLGFTDYYYPGLPVFDVSKSDGSHAFEINTGFEKDGFTLSANYILNEAGGAGSAGGDMYFQAGYAFTYFELFVGAGDGWHTSDGKFNVCNIGLGTSKEIQLTEKFSIPVIGQVILNPQREQLYIVVGLSF